MGSLEHQRELIALAARGAFKPEHLATIRLDAFTSDARLFAWACASRACRLLGRASSFFAARYMRVTAPRIDMPLESWAQLHRETEAEIDAAEAQDHERRKAERTGA